MIGERINLSHLTLVEAHVRELYSNISPVFHYHSLEHTLTVVHATREIGQHESLTEHEQLIAETAAWFHDVGYARSNVGHEELSSFRSTLVLTRMGVSFDDMELIEGCILVTQLGSEPTNQMQDVLCDADMYHLTMDDFWLWSGRLRREWQETQGLKMTNAEWTLNNIRFMGSVKMRTGYGQNVLLPRIQANIIKLEEMLESGLFPKA
jgi:predicted metal-dependent HD superfamily phosphohydrolase